jgi:bifunctional DNA primase/polymerase-like protein
MKLEDKDGPYGQAALKYIKAGWPEALPIWRGGTRDKQPMVKGYHGREGSWPDDNTNRLWANRYARANIALRLPRWVVGLDVDHYSDKYGGDSLAELQDKLGPLPGTFVSTARTDGISGIRLFMVPGDFANSAWPSQAAVDIDLITWYERYVICQPSMHRSGNEYVWYQQHGEFRHMREHSKLPSPSDMAMLPAEWCEYLTGLAGAGYEKWSESSFDGSARQWLIDYGSGEPCRYVEGIGVRVMERMNDGGSVHEIAKLGIAQLVKAAAEGHRGINTGLRPIRELFIYKLGQRGAGERRRGEGKAVQEWRSLVTGAVTKYGGDVADTDEVCDGLGVFERP